VGRALVGAIVVGALGDLYLIWGRLSLNAFTLPALAIPALAAGVPLAMGVAALRLAAPYDRGTLGAAIGLLITIGLLAVLNAVPPVARDELTHHLALPALYVRHGRIFDLPFADQSYYPMLLDMFYTPLLAFLPDNLPKYLHLLFGVGAAAWVVLLVRRQASGAVALLAGLLMLTTPVAMALAASAYVDLGVLFYATGALAALIVWAEDGRARWLIGAGLMAGFAGATKYNGLLVIPLLAVAPVWLAPPETRETQKVGLVLLFAAVALLPVAPWLIKNLLETGNPIFPLFNRLLGGREIPAPPPIGILAQRRLLYGESWLDIALIAPRIFVTGRDADPARFDGVFAPVLLLGLYAAWSRAASPRARLLFFYCCLYALMAFFLMTLRVRYSVVILAPLVLLTVDGLRELWSAGGYCRALAVAAVAGNLLFSLAHVGLLVQRLQPVAYLRGQITRDQYLARHVPEYPVLQAANRLVPPDGRVYLVFLGNRSYYCLRAWLSDMFLLPVTLRRAIERSRDASGVGPHLREHGITHLIAADELLDRYFRDNATAEQYQRWQQFIGTHARALHRANGVTLYALAAD
jgi:hypothetical protein